MLTFCPDSERDENAARIYEHLKADLGNGRSLYGMQYNTLKKIGLTHQQTEGVLGQGYVRLLDRDMKYLRGFRHVFDGTDAESCRNLNAWLQTMTRNLGLDYLKERKRGPEKVSLEDSGLQFAAHERSPLNQLLDEEKSNEVGEILGLIRREYREVLSLTYVEEMNYEDTAKKLGIPLGTVKSRIHSAKASFKRVAEICWS